MTEHRERLQVAAHNSRPDWFKVYDKTETAAGTTRATVMVYGEIGASMFSDDVTTAGDFAAEVAALDVDEIDLHLNSPGGDVYDGIAIANTIKAHKAKVIVTVDGLAASAASFIAVAGDELVMAANSELMIHDAWGAAMGNADDMRALADRLDKISNNLASMYKAKAGGELADWRAVMQAETWYSADEAVKAGLADSVLAPDDDDPKAKPKAAFDLRVYAHAGRANAPRPLMPNALAPSPSTLPAEPADARPPTPHPKGADMSDTIITGLRERLGLPADSDLDEAGLLAALDETLAEKAEAPQANASPPDGTVLVDEASLAELRAQAALGVQAHQRQVADDQAALVFAAVDDGRISPARRDHWLAALKADPGAAEVLATLAPDTVPVKAKGYTGGVEQAPDDDRIYAAAWPTTTTEGR